MQRFFFTRVALQAYNSPAGKSAEAPHQSIGVGVPIGSSGNSAAPGFYTVTAGGASVPGVHYAGDGGGSAAGAPMLSGISVGPYLTESTEALPTAADQPVFEPGMKDSWAAALFWVHFAVIFVLAFALGVPAMQEDGAIGDAAPRQGNLDFNASLFVRMVILAIFVGAAASALFFQILRRYGGALIKCALYTSAGVQVVAAVCTLPFAPVAGVFLLLSAAFTAWYIYWVRNRIPFAAAHLQIACDAINAYPSLFVVAVIVLAAQGVFILLWAMCSLGAEHSLNAAPAGKAARSAPGSDDGSAGGLIVFFLLISFFWGCQTFKNVVHFVTASVVGNWWFLGSPHAAVRGSLARAFSTNFGSIALGSLVTAVLHALEEVARNAQEQARRRGNNAGAFFAACATCLLGCLERAAEYFNSWAFVYCALTGCSFTHAGQEVVGLFRKRGWTAVINDDLAGSVLAIGCLMVGAVAAVVGGGTSFLFMGAASSGVVAGIVAFLCFLTGAAMASVMTGVLSSAVRTIFVCFALNPAALAATHPNHLALLVNAWHAAHPQELASCGYAAAYMQPDGRA